MATFDTKKKDDVSSSSFEDQEDAEMLTLDPQEERTFYNNQGKTPFFLHECKNKAVSSPCLNLKKMYQPVIPQKDQRIFEAYTFQQLILNPDVELVGTFHDSYQFYLTDFLNNHNETCKAIYRIQTNQPKCYYELNAKEFLKKSSFSPLNEYGTTFVTLSKETGKYQHIHDDMCLKNLKLIQAALLFKHLPSNISNGINFDKDSTESFLSSSTSTLFCATKDAQTQTEQTEASSSSLPPSTLMSKASAPPIIPLQNLRKISSSSMSSSALSSTSPPSSEIISLKELKEVSASLVAEKSSLACSPPSSNAAEKLSYDFSHLHLKKKAEAEQKEKEGEVTDYSKKSKIKRKILQLFDEWDKKINDQDTAFLEKQQCLMKQASTPKKLKEADDNIDIDIEQNLEGMQTLTLNSQERVTTDNFQQMDIKVEVQRNKNLLEELIMKNSSDSKDSSVENSPLQHSLKSARSGDSVPISPPSLAAAASASYLAAVCTTSRQHSLKTAGNSNDGDIDIDFTTNNSPKQHFLNSAKSGEKDDKPVSHRISSGIDELEALLSQDDSSIKSTYSTASKKDSTHHKSQEHVQRKQETSYIKDPVDNLILEGTKKSKAITNQDMDIDILTELTNTYCKNPELIFNEAITSEPLPMDEVDMLEEFLLQEDNSFETPTASSPPAALQHKFTYGQVNQLYQKATDLLAQPGKDEFQHTLLKNLLKEEELQSIIDEWTINLLALPQVFNFWDMSADKKDKNKFQEFVNFGTQRLLQEYSSHSHQQDQAVKSFLNNFQQELLQALIQEDRTTILQIIQDLALETTHPKYWVDFINHLVLEVQSTLEHSTWMNFNGKRFEVNHFYNYAFMKNEHSFQKYLQLFEKQGQYQNEEHQPSFFLNPGRAYSRYLLSLEMQLWNVMEDKDLKQVLQKAIFDLNRALMEAAPRHKVDSFIDFVQEVFNVATMQFQPHERCRIINYIIPILSNYDVKNLCAQGDSFQSEAAATPVNQENHDRITETISGNMINENSSKNMVTEVASKDSMRQKQQIQYFHDPQHQFKNQQQLSLGQNFQPISSMKRIPNQQALQAFGQKSVIHIPKTMEHSPIFSIKLSSPFQFLKTVNIPQEAHHRPKLVPKRSKDPTPNCTDRIQPPKNPPSGNLDLLLEHKKQFGFPLRQISNSNIFLPVKSLPVQTVLRRSASNSLKFKNYRLLQISVQNKASSDTNKLQNRFGHLMSLEPSVEKLTSKHDPSPLRRLKKAVATKRERYIPVCKAPRGYLAMHTPPGKGPQGLTDSLCFKTSSSETSESSDNSYHSFQEEDFYKEDEMKITEVDNKDEKSSHTTISANPPSQFYFLNFNQDKKDEMTDEVHQNNSKHCDTILQLDGFEECFSDEEEEDHNPLQLTNFTQKFNLIQPTNGIINALSTEELNELQKHMKGTKLPAFSVLLDNFRTKKQQLSICETNAHLLVNQYKQLESSKDEKGLSNLNNAIKNTASSITSCREDLVDLENKIRELSTDDHDISAVPMPEKFGQENIISHERIKGLTILSNTDDISFKNWWRQVIRVGTSENLSSEGYKYLLSLKLRGKPLERFYLYQDLPLNDLMVLLIGSFDNPKSTGYYQQLLDSYKRQKTESLHNALYEVKFLVDKSFPRLRPQQKEARVEEEFRKKLANGSLVSEDILQKMKEKEETDLDKGQHVNLTELIDYGELQESIKNKVMFEGFEQKTISALELKRPRERQEDEVPRKRSLSNDRSVRFPSRPPTPPQQSSNTSQERSFVRNPSPYQQNLGQQTYRPYRPPFSQTYQQRPQFRPQEPTQPTRFSAPPQQQRFGFGQPRFGPPQGYPQTSQRPSFNNPQRPQYGYRPFRPRMDHNPSTQPTRYPYQRSQDQRPTISSYQRRDYERNNGQGDRNGPNNNFQRRSDDYQRQNFNHYRPVQRYYNDDQSLLRQEISLQQPRYFRQSLRVENQCKRFRCRNAKPHSNEECYYQKNY